MSRPDCFFCKKEIPETDKHACLWLKGQAGVSVAFVCEKCSNERADELKDITADIKS